jgi:hypothetical protein
MPLFTKYIAHNYLALRLCLTLYKIYLEKKYHYYKGNPHMKMTS